MLNAIKTTLHSLISWGYHLESRVVIRYLFTDIIKLYSKLIVDYFLIMYQCRYFMFHAVWLGKAFTSVHVTKHEIAYFNQIQISSYKKL